MKQVKDLSRCERLTQVVWGLDWATELPGMLGEYELSASSFEEFNSLKKSSDSFLINSDVSNDSFVKDIGSFSKDNYLKIVSDFFTIKKEGKVVGVIVCEIQDWATYYLRYIFISKEHRSYNLTILFVRYIEKILRNYSVDKITCDISPSNLRQISRMSQDGYVYTGNILSERFGANVCLSKFLREESWKVYNSNFIQMYYTDNQREAMKPTLNI